MERCLSTLYKWIVKKQPADETAPATLAERIIVLLADERARRGAGLTLEELRSRAMTPLNQVERELKRLNTLSIAVNTRGRWTIRTGG